MSGSTLSLLCPCGGKAPLRERINNWTLDIPNNKIAGDVRLMNVDFLQYKKGLILGTINNSIVFARMEDTKIYALVLGTIQTSQVKNQTKFMQYLATKSLDLNAVIV